MPGLLYLKSASTPMLGGIQTGRGKARYDASISQPGNVIAECAVDTPEGYAFHQGGSGPV